MKNSRIAWVAFAVVLALSLGARSARARTAISFVTPAWLAMHLGDAGVRILDVRPDPHDYFRAHIPGAVHLADATLRGPERGVPVQYLPPGVLASLLARAGVTERTTVVVYSDGEDVLGATMTAYVLERLGHPRVLILDGGFRAYAAAHRTVQPYPSTREGRLPARDVRSIRVTLPEVRRLLGNPSVAFVDARPEPAYRGEIGTWMRNGHIPGALSLDWHLLVEPLNPHKIKSRDELRRVFASRGLTERSDIVVYCGTSREATLEYIVAKHVLGFSRVRLYEGSWTEYAAHPDLPVERGPRASGGSRRP